MTEQEQAAAAIVQRARGDGAIAAAAFVRSLTTLELAALSRLQHTDPKFAADFAELMNLVADRKLLEERQAAMAKALREALDREAKAAAEASVSQETLQVRGEPAILPAV